jgi:glycosyltransferase involved in cell wall biosynthesis
VNILFLSRWFPYPPDNGAKIRIFNVLKQLASRHDVTLLTFRGSHEPGTGQNLAALSEHCVEVRAVPYQPYRPTSGRSLVGLFSNQPRFLVDTYSRDMSAAIEGALHTRHYDLVIASQLDMIPYAVRLRGYPLLLEELEVGQFLDAARRTAPVARRIRALLTWQKLRLYLRQVLPRFSTCTVVSDRERTAVQRIVPNYNRLRIIPNAIDPAGYLDAFGEPSEGTLVFCGALTYSPNLDALQLFLREVLPTIHRSKPDVVLRVTGSTTGVNRELLPWHSGVHYTGYVPDIRPVVARSWATVVPLRTGGGTRLKILESMALGTPVVSTKKGAEGLEVTHGDDILLADDPQTFARRTVDLLQSLDLRGRLASGGRRLVESRYNWQIVGQELRALVEQVVA